MRYFFIKDGKREERIDTSKKIRNLINSMSDNVIVLVIDGCLYIIAGGKRDAKL